MFKKYRFNPFLWIFLFALVPLQSMETDPRKEEVVIQFFDAIEACDVNVVKTILKNNLKILNKHNPYDVTASERAAIAINQHQIKTNPSHQEMLIQLFNATIQAGNVKAVKTILKHNPTVVHTANPDDGTTALQKAITINLLSNKANKHRPEIVQLLLKSGASTENLGAYLLIANNNDDQYNCAIQIAHLLFSYGMAIDSGNDQPYQEDRESILRKWQNDFFCDEMNNRDHIEIAAEHIHTRLYKAIEDGNAQEVRRLVQKYGIDINTSLSSYNTFNYGTPSASVWLQNIKPSNGQLPLHLAVMYQQDAIVRLLVDELHADVNIQSERGATVFHQELDIQTAQFLLSKGANPNIPDNNGAKPIDSVNFFLTPEMLGEIGHQTERVENFRALKATFEGKPYVPRNIPNNNGAGNNNNNNQRPDPLGDDPTNIITNSTLPWKWIGGGVAVVVVVVAAKKLYNWWHTKTEPQELTEAEVHNEQKIVADAQS